MIDRETKHRTKATALLAAAALAQLLLVSCRNDGADPDRASVGPVSAAPAAPAAGGAAASSSDSAARSPIAGLVPAEGPLELSVPEAILVALDGNRSLAIEKLGPAIRQTYLQTERSAFEPALGVDVSRSRSVTDDGSGRSVSESTSVGATGSVYLPTGTSVELSADCDITDSSAYSDLHDTRLGLSVTQSLLQGRGLGTNLAALRSARLDVLSSEYELRGFAESLVATVEGTCWDYALAGREIEIVTDSLKLAEQQLAETEERVKVGKLAETELAAAQAEVAGRREALIEARSKLAKTHLTLIRLLCPGGRTDWDRELRLKHPPAVPEVKLDPVEKHVAVAMRMRPDLNQARLALRRGELELVRTRNGLLPRLDLFVTLGASGYASSFGNSLEDVDGDSYDTRVGLRFDLPLGNGAARAGHRRSVLRLEEAREALVNMSQLVELDVRTAFIEVGRAGEQITATAATRKAQEEALRAETAKFRVGKSTAFLVAQAQRDVLASQIAEVRALVSYLKALVDLHRLEGSLLERRGVKAPGAAGEAG